VVICPNCRNENLEDATVCTKCGGSLDPGVSRLLPVRRTEDERPPFELHTPKPPSVWRAVAVFGIFALLAAGIGVYYLGRPNPCAGTNFTSTNFGYCVLVPDGWEAGPARFGADVTLDQFAPPTASSTVIVSSVDLDSGATLSDFSNFVRQRDDAAGLTPGPTSETTVDGVGATQWDVTVETDGETYRMREVVTVRDDVGWRITLNDVRQDFATSAVAFRDLLDSWRFR
jgi:zinc-ribbon domain